MTTAELNVMPLGETAEERWGHPYFNVYRPDLISLLAALSDEATFHYATKIHHVVIDDRETDVDLGERRELRRRSGDRRGRNPLPSS